MISFESEEVQLQRLREQLRVMSDAELIAFGKSVRSLLEPRVVSAQPCAFDRQLEEARSEWRRRHE
jgi:hypothetical protein